VIIQRIIDREDFMSKIKLDKSVIPKKLRKCKQWVGWKYGPQDQNGRAPKIPIDPKTGKSAKTNNSGTWGTFKKACQRYEKDDLDGIGFVFTGDDPYCGIDLDNCRNQETGKIKSWAKEIIKDVNCYTEVSPSGTGVKIILEGKLPGPSKRSGKIEMYDHDRYFTITGQCSDDLPKELKKKSTTIGKIYNRLFKEKATATDNHTAKSALDNKKKSSKTDDSKTFEKLRKGDWSDYTSHSEADFAFVSRLLRQTGGDAEQADSLFRKSKLYREKWDEEHSANGKTYGQITIEKAMTSYFNRISEKVAKALKSDEQGDADIFIELNKGKLCYDHEESKWYIFGENYWEIDKKKAAEASIRTVINFYQKELDRLAKSNLQEINDRSSSKRSDNDDFIKKINDRIKKLNTLGRRKRILELASAGENSLGITGEEWDTKPWVIACINGVLSLQGEEVKFKKGKPDDYIKTPAPTMWERIEAEAPLWKNALKEIFQNDKKLIRHIQKMFGYALSGSCQQHVFNILDGAGRNGKSTIIETISYVLGELATPIPVETLLSQTNVSSGGAPRADIMKLRGRRVAWASESDEGRRLNASLIKLLTGGDTITARTPYSKEMATFSPTHTIFMITNDMPHLDINDYALWQRIHVIPFLVSFVPSPEEEFERKADLELKEKLKIEAPGILAWLVKGCLAAQKRGLKPPPAVVEAIKRYQRKEDTLGLFIEECCKLGPNKRAGATELFDAYKSWCKENESFSLSQTNFGKQMGKKFTRKSSNGILYLGLRLKQNLG
jgi:putative DNA primase/helicase